MNIKDEQFSNLIKYSDYGNAVYSPEAVALRFAGILADMTKNKASFADIALWASVPSIGADAKRFDIVKDFSIRPSHVRRGGVLYELQDGGQVGVVTEVREIRKRDGRTAVEVEIVFFNHTTIGKYRSDSAKRRKLQFIKGEQIDTSVPAYLLKG
jgi:hypothetical protein